MNHVIIGGDSKACRDFIHIVAGAIDHLTVIFPETQYAQSLPADFRGNLVIGDLKEESTLEKANISSADTVFIWTMDEDINALLAVTAKRVYNVKNVVVYTCETNNSKLYEKFEIDTVTIHKFL
ncbi:Trk K+ transport system NAD-binding subunit [Anaerosolibacter carboniphilus]|uniref:Trk K+ transport system NAD-binding subunit n=1 Tax=Anaerosolibacter carboniphilus TaxID=1417629 RepID=A0A841KPZ8_9FIRM|nr:NAD-binding protein [Anaerosolibacter carboniphilus]MBB6214178.1 Trk K+ transport system NAD-binding subunit [Anaerosolibacter carboniphilus]